MNLSNFPILQNRVYSAHSIRPRKSVQENRLRKYKRKNEWLIFYSNVSPTCVRFIK